MSKQRSARSKRRHSDGMMPSSGAGLIRFYQDQSNGVKLTPLTALIISGVFILAVIVGHTGWLNFIFYQ